MTKSLALLFTLFLSITVTLTSQTYNGYTLYSKMGSNKAYLLNMDKTIYHSWTLSPSTGYSTYLLPNQILLRAATYSGNQLNGAAMCGMVQKLDWSGTVIWQYIYSTSTYCTHHDICPMPNGNVLLISYEVKSPTEVTQAGCSQNITMWPDKIVEVQPSGTNGGNIVWEWHAWDHLCQNVNAAKNNYVTSISQHPELLNINYNTQKDWMHTNGIDYNPELDQIVFSSHYLNEIYVIDHSTTTAEAASHTGGNSGKGGDILYRWGNPAAYSCGTSANQVFKVVHDAHWIDSGCPHAGDLVGFNNQGASGNHSCVDRVTPPINGYLYNGTPGTAFTPSTYTARHVCLSDASNQSNSQQLPNGNTLVCISTTGYIYEIDSNQTLLWSYTAGGSQAKAFRYTECYVNGNMTVDASASPGQICSGNTSQLGATLNVGTATSYSWTSNPAGFNSTLQNPVVSPGVTTTYYVTAMNGSCSASDSVVVTVNNAFQVTATATPQSICAGQSSQLNASSTAGTSVTYSWTSDPAGFTSSLQNPVVYPTVTTIYFVTVSNGSCSVTNSVTVNINSPFTVQSASNPGSICYGESSQLSSSVTGATASYSYNWSSNPAGFTSTLQNPVVSPQSTTVYTVTVSDGSCSQSSSATVNVIGPVTVDAGASSTQVCQGETVQLSAQATGGISYSYNWTSNPAGFTSTLQNPQVIPSVSTMYYVNVNSAPCYASDSVEVIVLPLPATPTIHQSNDTLFSSAQSGNQWYRNSELLSGQTLPYFIAHQSGNYQVRTTDENGCSSAISATFPYVYTGIAESISKLAFYPNPTNGLVYLDGQFASEENLYAIIYDSKGMIVQKTEFSNFLDLTTLPNGLYIVSILKDSRLYATARISLQK